MRIRIEEGFPLVEAGMDSTGTNTAHEPGATPLLPVPAAAPDLVTVPARQGLEAVDIIRRGAGRTACAPGVGPVLHDGSGDTLGFLVPPGTADAWDLPGSACTQTNGRGMRFGDTAAPTSGGTGWLLPPDAVGPVTDPEVLRAALGEAARLIEAADNCR
ncbi:hypothetical protein SLAV_23805 [Streptomyces lavendulae subsp. lavendulae]|uniref:Uncharacterized protein n=2 Tax=Streptomyces TaxID=1883 RepID=A0A2K8PLP7_STRLA|nr:hypothetical protein SLAV_23805 [Streptomyces lavendulae subsp. lavendulae]MDH6539451.1 hypothetical protein [Streptomyces sp. SPB4]QUQ56393.1 hypothetical protein SLLC_21930 [Streptomyces lavendulae subsp. lavendulae]